MSHSLRRLFVQGGRRALSLFEYQIYYSLAPPQKTTSFQMHTGQSKLFVGQRPFKRTKQSWGENGCSCLFVLIWITEYASLGGRIRSACASSHWYFPPTLRIFSSGYSSCTDEKSNNPLDVHRQIAPCWRNSFPPELTPPSIMWGARFTLSLMAREKQELPICSCPVPPETAHNTVAKQNAF